MNTLRKTLTVCLVIAFCSPIQAQRRNGNKSSKPTTARNRTSQQDQLQIVAGKLLSMAVSSEEEVAVSPPGKWVNTWGFTYFRYTERGTGRNKVSLNGLLSKMADGAASVLNENQLRLMTNIVAHQENLEAEASKNREELIRELFQWRTKGKGDKARILALAEKNGQLLAELLNERRQAYEQICESLTSEQDKQLRAVRAGEFQSTKSVRKLARSKKQKQELTLMLGKFITWSTGTPDMNRVIDAGRPAVFFGFANLRMANRNSGKRSQSLRGDASKTMLGLLNARQMTMLKELISEQAKYLKSYLDQRGQLGALLSRNPSTGAILETSMIKELCVGSEVAEAQLGIIQAERMSSIIRSFSDAQTLQLDRFKSTTAGVGRRDSSLRTEK